VSSVSRPASPANSSHARCTTSGDSCRAGARGGIVLPNWDVFQWFTTALDLGAGAALILGIVARGAALAALTQHVFLSLVYVDGRRRIALTGRGDPPIPVRRCCERSGLDESAFDGVAREFDAVAHAELGEDVLAVAFDGLA